jgi:hypothetical protein
LKEPLGWVFSSFRRIVQPARVERGVLFIRGVEIQGFLYVGVGDGEEEGFEWCVWMEGGRAMVTVVDVAVMLPIVMDIGGRYVFEACKIDQDIWRRTPRTRGNDTELRFDMI